MKMTAFDPMSSDQNIGETQVQSGKSLDSNVICTDKVITTNTASLNQTGIIFQ